MKKFMKEIIIIGVTVIVMLITIASCSRATVSNEEVEYELRPNQIGYHLVVSENSGHYTSYLLLTPRGFERCEGDHNLLNSLETYMRRGDYAKEIMSEDEAVEIIKNYRY